MKRPPKFAETNRLILRPFLPTDCHDVFEYASNPEVTRLMDWPTHQTLDTSKEWIEHTLAQWGGELDYAWGIATKQNPHKLIGSVGCTQISYKVSFGYVFNQNYWGQGFATEAATWLVDTLSELDGVRRIWATCDCENTASARVLTKSGCALEGTLKNWLVRPNLPGAPVRDNYVYAKVI